jgi:hypothetical protein
MDMAEEHLFKRQQEVEGMNMTEECLSMQRSEVEDMDMTDIHMVDDTMTEVERVEREHKDVVSVKH